MGQEETASGFTRGGLDIWRLREVSSQKTVVQPWQRVPVESPSLQGFKSHGDVPVGDRVEGWVWQCWVKGWRSLRGFPA